MAETIHQMLYILFVACIYANVGVVVDGTQLGIVFTLVQSTRYGTCVLNPLLLAVALLLLFCLQALDAFFENLLFILLVPEHL